MKKITVSVAAIAALALSACGGDAGEETSPSVTSTTSDAATSAPAATETAPETSDEATAAESSPAASTSPDATAPASQSPEAKEFTDKLREAMRSVEHVKQTMTMKEQGEEQIMTTYLDMSDPNKPRQYTVLGEGETRVETVLQDGKLYSRMGEGAWEEKGAFSNEDFDNSLAPQVSSLEQVDDRTYDVVMSNANMPGTQIEATITVDDQFRSEKMEMTQGDTEVVATYDYDTTMEIPTVS